MALSIIIRKYHSQKDNHLRLKAVADKLEGKFILSTIIVKKIGTCTKIIL
jgi:hypothetical protein